jgi:hypothetical protein
MAIELPVTGGDAPHLVAAADLSAKQYFGATINSSGKIALAGAAAACIGIIQNAPVSGKAVTLRRMGISKAVAGGTIAVGDRLTTDSAGKLIKGFGADPCVALALQAGVSGDIVSVDVVGVAGGFCQHAPHTKSFPLDLVGIAGAGQVIGAITPGYAGRIAKAYFVTNKPVTTAAKLATLQPKIGSTNLTGGAIALTSANATPLGAVVAGSAVTAANTFLATDTIAVDASAVTAFVEGTGSLVIEFA